MFEFLNVREGGWNWLNVYPQDHAHWIAKQKLQKSRREEQYRDQDIHFDLKKEKSSDERSNSVYLLSSACSELLSNIITMGILVGRNVKSWKLRWNCDEICSYLIVHPGVHFFLILTPFVMKDWMKSNYRWDQRERDICCITVSNRHYSTQR